MRIVTKDADEAAFFWVQPRIEFTGTELKYGYRKKVLLFVFETDMDEQEFEHLKNEYMNGKRDTLDLNAYPSLQMK